MKGTNESKVSKSHGCAFCGVDGELDKISLQVIVGVAMQRLRDADELWRYAAGLRSQAYIKKRRDRQEALLRTILIGISNQYG